MENKTSAAPVQRSVGHCSCGFCMECTQDYKPIRIGDIVRHKTTGELWLVAKVCENGDIIAAGWPCTYARPDEIELAESCGDIQNAHLILCLQGLPASDPRHIPPNPEVSGPPSGGSTAPKC